MPFDTPKRPAQRRALHVSNLCALCLVPMFASVAPPFSERDIHVSTVAEPASAKITSQVSLAPRPDGARILEVTLTNDSGRDLALTSVEVSLPWATVAGERGLLAAGACSTGRWPPTLIFDPRKDRTEPVSGMYLLARTDAGCALAGFVSWRTFWSKLHYEPGTLVMTADGESRRMRAGETLALEKIRLTEGNDWSELLFKFAGAIAEELKIPRRTPQHFVGWSPWDYYGRDFPADAVRGNVAVLPKLIPQANLVQIDGGWWRERGDYASVRENLGADGMKKFATEFRARGYTAGVHIDGVRFSPDSEVARAHPEYFLHDENGKLLRERNHIDGQISHLFVDYSNPGACAYMRDSLRRLRRDWGYDYIKIDYLRCLIAEDVRRDAFGSEPGHHIARFDRGITSVEAAHRALRAFREGMGEDAYFVGCSTPFGPTFGYVDALRTGPDISPQFNAYVTQCEANASNFYFNGQVFAVDSDYEVVRAKEDQDATLVKSRAKDGGALAFNEAEMWTHYVALFSQLKIASDNLMILRDERKELVRFALTQPACSRFVPLDFWSHARARNDPYQVFLGEADGAVLLALFNWSDAPRTYTVAGLPKPDALGNAIVHGTAEVAGDHEGPRVALGARHSVIFRLPADTDFDRARREIDVR